MEMGFEVQAWARFHGMDDADNVPRDTRRVRDLIVSRLSQHDTANKLVDVGYRSGRNFHRRPQSQIFLAQLSERKPRHDGSPLASISVLFDLLIGGLFPA
jgi:hypothetical protein